MNTDGNCVVGRAIFDVGIVILFGINCVYRNEFVVLIVLVLVGNEHTKLSRITNHCHGCCVVNLCHDFAFEYS